MMVNNSKTHIAKAALSYAIHSLTNYQQKLKIIAAHTETKAEDVLDAPFDEISDIIDGCARILNGEDIKQVREEMKQNELARAYIARIDAVQGVADLDNNTYDKDELYYD